MHRWFFCEGVSTVSPKWREVVVAFVASRSGSLQCGFTSHPCAPLPGTPLLLSVLWLMIKQRKWKCCFPPLVLQRFINARPHVAPINPVVGLSPEPWIFPACLPCSALGSDGTRQSHVPLHEMLLVHRVALHTFQKGPSLSSCHSSKAGCCPTYFLEGLRKQLFGWTLGHFQSLTLRSLVNAPHSDTRVSDHVFTVVTSTVHMPPPSFSLLFVPEEQFFFFLNHLLEFCARIGCMDPLHLCRFIRIPFQGKFEDRRRRQPWLTAS